MEGALSFLKNEHVDKGERDYVGRDKQIRNEEKQLAMVSHRLWAQEFKEIGDMQKAYYSMYIQQISGIRKRGSQNG